MGSRKEVVMGKESTTEREFKATITSDGQITVPADVRKLWNLKPGDQIGFGALDASEGKIRPIRRRSIFESMKDLPPLSLGRPLRQSDIEDAITAAVTEKEERSRGRRAP
jgi:AbrB family looped-hinge helix DNA binding protein